MILSPRDRNRCKWLHIIIPERKCYTLLKHFISNLLCCVSNNYKHIVLRKFYRIGTFTGLLLMLLSFVALSASSIYIVCRIVTGVFASLFADDTIRSSLKDSSTVSSVMFTPLVPGVNLPISDIPLLLVILTVSLAIHELGHSITAYLNNVRTTEAGLFIIGIFPAAYCSVDNDDMKLLNFWKRLDIYFGGIVNNLTLAFSTFIFLSCILNVVLGVFYVKGLTVVSLSDQITMASPRAKMNDNDQKNAMHNDWKIGDKIVEFNSVPIMNKIEWYNQIIRYVKQQQDKPYYANNTVPVTSTPSLSKIFKIKRGNTILSIDGKSIDNIARVYNSLNLVEYQFQTRRLDNHNDSAHVVEKPTKEAALKILLYIPSTLRHICMFIIMINASLAIMNIFPIYHFDGMQIIPIVLLIYFPSTYLEDKRRLKYDTHRLLKVGFRMFVMNIIFACLSLIL
eukprot:g8604.t1